MNNIRSILVANRSESAIRVFQASVTKSLTINGWLANRSKSISEQRRALMLPQELMQFPVKKLILLRGGIPTIIGTKIVHFSDSFFKRRIFLAPVVQAIPKATPPADAPAVFRDMTPEEAAGQATRPMPQDDISTKDCPSQFADLVTIDHNGKVIGTLDEGDENG